MSAAAAIFKREVFDPDCRQCPRLAAFLAEGKARHPSYHCGPVAPFGAANARLLVVGLAPGFHGANASGRPFTGDHAGLLLYRTLHRFGFASRPVSLAADDGLELINCRISNAVKCVPPQNKPLPAEISQCSQYLRNELATLEPGTVILALGLIAHDAVLRGVGLKRSVHRFAHAAEHDLDAGMTLLDSYHCSRYNTQTRRLTEDMFARVFARAAELLSKA